MPPTPRCVRGLCEERGKRGKISSGEPSGHLPSLGGHMWGWDVSGRWMGWPLARTASPAPSPWITASLAGSSVVSWAKWAGGLSLLCIRTSVIWWAEAHLWQDRAHGPCPPWAVFQNDKASSTVVEVASSAADTASAVKTLEREQSVPWSRGRDIHSTGRWGGGGSSCTCSFLHTQHSPCPQLGPSSRAEQSEFLTMGDKRGW